MYSNPNILHKKILEKISFGLRQGRDYLLLGPLGIGKTRLLKNLHDNALRLNYNPEANFQYEDLNSGQIQNLVETIQSAPRSPQNPKVFLLDNIDIAIARSNDPKPFVDLFDTLAMFPDWMSSSPRYIIASLESPWDLLRRKYPGILNGHKLPDTNKIVLRLVVDEARDFLISAGGDANRKSAMSWLDDYADKILQITGSYPWFLQTGIEVLYFLDRFDIEDFKEAYMSRTLDRLQELWASCSEEERRLLCTIASDRDVSKEPEYLLSGKSLANKCLITETNELFSSNFKDFILMTAEYREYKRRKKQPAWLPRIDKMAVTYVILAVIFLYISALIVIPFWGNAEWILVSTLVFVILFIVLMFIYINSDE